MHSLFQSEHVLGLDKFPAFAAQRDAYNIYSDYYSGLSLVSDIDIEEGILCSIHLVLLGTYQNEVKRRMCLMIHYKTDGGL